MDVSGKVARVWVNEHPKRDGTKWYDYNIGIGKKNAEGRYINAYMKLKFSKDLGLPEELPNGIRMEDYEGYVSVYEYQKDGQLVRVPLVMITKARFPELELILELIDPPDSFEMLDEEVPF